MPSINMMLRVVLSQGRHCSVFMVVFDVYLSTTFFLHRLTKEVTAAREALATLKPHTGVTGTKQPPMQAQTKDLPETPSGDNANVS